jgi:hypothetical protein
MNRKSTKLAVALILALVGTVWFVALTPRTPRWEGKSLAEWFNGNTTGFYKAADYQALLAAFKSNGSNAVPFLLDKALLKSWRPEPRWREWLRTRTWIPAGTRKKYFPPRLDAVACQNRALTLLAELGPEARAAQPVLIKLLENSSVSWVPNKGGLFGGVVDELKLKPDAPLGIPPLTRASGWSFVEGCLRALSRSEPQCGEAIDALWNVAVRMPHLHRAARDALLSPAMVGAMDANVGKLVAALDHDERFVRENARTALAQVLVRHARDHSTLPATATALKFAHHHQVPVERLAREWVEELTLSAAMDASPAQEALTALVLESPSLMEQAAAGLKARNHPQRARVLGTMRGFVGDLDQTARFEVPALERNQPPVNLPAKVVQLALGNDSAAFSAAQRLGQAGSRGALALPALIEALGYSNERVVARVAESLGQIGPEARAALPALRACLTNESWMVRAAATNALQLIEQPAP